MRIEVSFANGHKVAFQGEYEVTEAGVLRVTPEDTSKGVFVYSPSHWTEIRHATPEPRKSAYDDPDSEFSVL